MENLNFATKWFQVVLLYAYTLQSSVVTRLDVTEPLDNVQGTQTHRNLALSKMTRKVSSPVHLV